MGALNDALRELQAAQGDITSQAAVTAEFAVAVQPKSNRDKLRAALDAAAVLHWFEVPLLAYVLEINEQDARERFEALATLPFVERFPSREGDVRNVHNATRLGWRRRLFAKQPERFRAVSARAAAFFHSEATPRGCIEWIYHLLSADPDEGATRLESLDRDWSGSAHLEDRQALAVALRELEETNLVRGRAQAWVLLNISWARVNRGESAQLRAAADRALELARAARDARAEADAQCLLGDVFQSQGKLDERMLRSYRILRSADDWLRWTKLIRVGSGTWRWRTIGWVVFSRCRVTWMMR